MLDLPVGDRATIELDDSLRPELRARAERDELAPELEPVLLRYLVYLGAAYLEAEQLVSAAADPEEAYRQLSRRVGGVTGRTAVLRFHYSDHARRFAEERRAKAAHDRMAGAHAGLVERFEDEIAVREERVRNLREARR